MEGESQVVLFAQFSVRVLPLEYEDWLRLVETAYDRCCYERNTVVLAECGEVSAPDLLRWLVVSYCHYGAVGLRGPNPAVRTAIGEVIDGTSRGSEHG